MYTDYYFIWFFLFIPQFDYVPDASMIQRRGTSAMPLVSFNTATFHGVHKTLEMKQCLDHSGQPTFITNSSYCVKGRLLKGKVYGTISPWSQNISVGMFET